MKRFLWLAPVVLSVGCAECDQPFEKHSNDPPAATQQPQSTEQGSGKFKNIPIKKPFVAPNEGVVGGGAPTAPAPAAASASASASAK